MAERPVRSEEKTKAEGLSVEELGAQVGSLLPDRIEMRRRRRRRGGTNSPCGGLVNVACGGIDIDIL